MHHVTPRRNDTPGWFRTSQRHDGKPATLSGEVATATRVNLIDTAIYVTWIGIVATIFI